jgi:hypothetical protein
MGGYFIIGIVVSPNSIIPHSVCPLTAPERFHPLPRPPIPDCGIVISSDHPSTIPHTKKMDLDDNS